jgi:hypothetical protein
MNYKITKNSPVAKFWYKGSHSHPVKRTVLIIESDKNTLTGYEIREGAKIRKLSKAPIKSYSRDKIARGENLRLENPQRKESPKKSTLIRKEILDIIENGI